MYLDGIFDMWDWIKSFWTKQPSTRETKVIVHRGIKGYFSPEMIQELETEKIDYEKAFRESVDEFLDEIDEDDEDNPYR